MSGHQENRNPAPTDRKELRAAALMSVADQVLRNFDTEDCRAMALAIAEVLENADMNDWQSDAVNRTASTIARLLLVADLQEAALAEVERPMRC